jgi:hypothetical protein
MFNPQKADAYVKNHPKDSHPFDHLKGGYDPHTYAFMLEKRPAKIGCVDLLLSSTSHG